MIITSLKRKGAFIFDLEGVLLNNIDDPKPYPYAQETISELKAAGKRVLVLTNVARVSSKNILEKLRKAGFDLIDDEILTASSATALYVKSMKPNAKCFVISEGGLQEEFKLAGIKMVANGPADFVVVGVDRALTYKKLNQAMRLLLGGTELICTGGSLSFKGVFEGDEGVYLGEASIAGALGMATRKTSTIIGKPQKKFFEQALKIVGHTPKKTVMVGDILESDIIGAKKVGMTTILVSGKAAKIHGAVKPDIIVRDICELHNILVGKKVLSIKTREF